MSQMTFLTQQQEAASRLRLDLNKPDQVALVKRWLNQSQQEIWAAYDWQWALDREIVQTVVDKTAGTVAVAASGQTVTGTSTAFASSDVGSYIQFSASNDWYKVSSVASATSLAIEAPFTGTTALTAGTCTIRKVFYSVSASVEKILSVRQTISPKKLEMVHFRAFDRYRPIQFSTGFPASIVVYGYDSSNRWTFTLDPIPSQVMNLEIRTKKKATDLSADTDVSLIPEKWHATVMLDGALYRGLEYLRTTAEDKRAEFKKSQFDDGISKMVADADPESDYAPQLETADRKMTLSDAILKLPPRYDGSY